MKFGVLSTATIARREFIPAIAKTEHELVAIASRSEGKAKQTAEEYGISRAYGSYEELLADDSVEAVYVPVPNSEHATWTKRAADNGKHVLCEKPLGVTAAEAREMGEYCESKGVTLMEALMYRYHPRTDRAVEVVRDELGDARAAAATFHSSLDHWPAGTRLNPELGGGSVLDVGVYAVNAIRLFLGEPDRVYATAADTEDSGVDTQLTGLLAYEDGVTGTVSSSFDTVNTQHYHVEGTDGWLRAQRPFGVSSEEEAVIEYGDADRRTSETFAPVDQYQRELAHFVECVETGERPRTDATEAARTLAVIDALRESANTGEIVSVQQL